MPSTETSSSSNAQTSNNQDASTAYSVQSGAIPAFLQLLEDWKFNPPHNNLWTIEINLHNDGGEGNHNLLALFKNIDNVNQRYKLAIDTQWDIKKSSSDDFMNDYLNRLQGSKNAFFLAQSVSYDVKSVSLNTNIGANLQQAKGFLNLGMIEAGLTYSNNVRVQFLETNWNLSEILFDKWIAAVAQQGLIEDSSLPCIKADIKINEYAGSVPSGKGSTKSDSKEWQLRKITNLYQAVPTNRDNPTWTYDAPSLKTATVTFLCLDYNIEYVV